MEHKLGDGATMQLAQWVSALAYRHLPERTRNVVRFALLDTVGCGIYGYQTPWTQLLL